MLEPASATVPAAASNKNDQEDDDQKCGRIHVSLRWLEADFVILNESLAQRGAPLDPERETDHNEGYDNAGESEGQNVADLVPRHASSGPIGG